jgi:hypothetical protein
MSAVGFGQAVQNEMVEVIKEEGLTITGSMVYELQKDRLRPAIFPARYCAIGRR